MTRSSSIAPIPPGALDLAGDAVRRRRELQGRMLERLEAGGYEGIIPPTFEDAEGFVGARGGAADIAGRLVCLPDLGGKAAAVGHPLPASRARLAATQRAHLPTP